MYSFRAHVPSINLNLPVSKDKLSSWNQSGIKSLKLIGDRKYVNIALGVLTATATIGLLQYIWLSLPSLFPSIFGAAVGKVIVIVSAVAVVAAAGTAITLEPSISDVTLISVPFEEIGTGPRYTITAEIPQLTGSSDPRVQAFNQTLNDLVQSVGDSYRNQFPARQRSERLRRFS